MAILFPDFYFSLYQNQQMQFHVHLLVHFSSHSSMLLLVVKSIKAYPVLQIRIAMALRPITVVINCADPKSRNRWQNPIKVPGPGGNSCALIQDINLLPYSRIDINNSNRCANLFCF